MSRGESAGRALLDARPAATVRAGGTAPRGVEVSAAPRIVRRCPGCGAAIEHGENDGAVGCDFCGLHLAIAADAGVPSYATAARGAPQRWLAEAKAALRGAGVRVRAMVPPRAVLVPYHRLRAQVWQWYRAAPRPDGDENESPLLAPGKEDERYRMGAWDATVDAIPSLGLGPGNLGVRTQVLAWTPLADFLGAAPDAGVDHAVLPAELDTGRGGGALRERLSSGWQLPAEDASEQWTLVTDALQQLVHAPFLLCPYLGGHGRAAVLLDGITLRAVRQLAEDELTELEARETSARQCPPDALPAGALVPLTCPECSCPLPLVARARVHRCATCQRHWVVRDGALVPVPCVTLAASAGSLSSARSVFLPFYRLRGSGTESYIPAARGRSPRAAWNFALGLARLPRTWEEANPLEAIPIGPGTEDSPTHRGGLPAVEVTPDTARTLAGFAARVLGRPDPGPVESELVWIAFVPRGPDLVEPGSGLGLPRAALRPLEVSSRRVAPRTPGARGESPREPGRAGVEQRTGS